MVDAARALKFAGADFIVLCTKSEKGDRHGCRWRYPIQIGYHQLFQYLKIKPATDRASKFLDFVDKVKEIGKPKALYKSAYIEEKGNDTITSDGVTFTSVALRKNLNAVERVFPYVATCGTELDISGIG